MTNQAALIMGHLIGKRIVGMRTVQKTPVGYSFDGVKLPVFPKWDKSKYPYAYMSGPALANLYLCSVPVTHMEEADGDGSGFYLLGDTSYSYLRYSATGNISAEWKLSETVENATEDKLLSFDQQNTAVEVIWTNTDMIRTDGTLYLAASEPIPVYE